MDGVNEMLNCWPIQESRVGNPCCKTLLLSPPLCSPVLTGKEHFWNENSCMITGPVCVHITVSHPLYS